MKVFKNMNTILVAAFRVSLLSGTLFVPCSAVAQVLENDNCVGALPLTNGVPYVMSTASATTAGDTQPQQCWSGFQKGVWFSYTPSTDGLVVVSTCGSDFQTRLTVFAGDCAVRVQLACGYSDPSFCGVGDASHIAAFVGKAATTYHILAGGYQFSSGGADGTLRIVATGPRVVNDECIGAVPLTNGVPYMMSTASATTAGDTQPQQCWSGFQKGVWFSYTPSTDGLVVVSTC
ncbi:MAG TPA: hypothetical protein VFA77_04445, partial [Candidatus Eisenbacteria bacterium]|nr:hypothetical protein [Candidatus Eisenbacteria bacterium]